MAQWVVALALVICVSAEVSKCGPDSAATCSTNDEHALVQKDLFILQQKDQKDQFIPIFGDRKDAKSNIHWSTYQEKRADEVVGGLAQKWKKTEDNHFDPTKEFALVKTEGFAAVFNVNMNGARVVKDSDIFDAEKEQMGRVVIQVHPEWAPIAAQRFHEMINSSAAAAAYCGEDYPDTGNMIEGTERLGQADLLTATRFHRVIKDFMVQLGISVDPRATKFWQSESIKDETVKGHSNKRGTIAFAANGTDTRLTQFFVNTVDNEFLDKQGYRPFGEVIQGMDVIEQVYAGYGEEPSQVKIATGGYSYLQEMYPKLSHVRTTNYLDMKQLREYTSSKNFTTSGFGFDGAMLANTRTLKRGDAGTMFPTDIDEFKFMGHTYKMDGPFMFCRYSPLPVACAVSMAPKVLFKTGGLYNSTSDHMKKLNEDGTLMEESQEPEEFEQDTTTEKPLLQAATDVASKIATKAGYDEEKQDAVVETMRGMRDKASDGVKGFMDKPEDCLMHPLQCLSKVSGGASNKLTGWKDSRSWMKQNSWCPQKRGECGIMVGLKEKNATQLVALTVLGVDEDADVTYLETLSKAEGNPTMGVTYPPDMKIACCKMYTLLKGHPSVTFVDFDVMGHKIEELKRSDRQLKLKAAEGSLGEDSAGSRVAFGVAAVLFTALVSLF